MNRKRPSITLGFMLGCLFPLSTPQQTLSQEPPPSQHPNPERNAFFGETHVHTSWSFDAYVFGNMKAGPEDAYKYAMGQPIDASCRIPGEDHSSARFHGGD